MNKKQRRRLATLSNQASLNAAEKLELAALQKLAISATIATAATEAPADETDEEKKKREEEEAAAEDETTDETTDDKTDETAEDDAPAEETDEEKKKRQADEAAKSKGATSLSGILAGAFATLKTKKSLGTGLAAAQATIGILTTERDTARSTAAKAVTERDTARTEATNLRGTLTAFSEFFGIPSADLGKKSSADILKHVGDKISSGVAQKFTELGFSAEALPPSHAGDDANDSLIARYNAITDPAERAKFYAAHSAEMFGNN